MRDFLRQCLMTKSTKLVVKNSLLLLFIEIFSIMRNWLKMIKSFICCIVVKINFRKINILHVKQYWIFCIVSNAVLLYALSIDVVETSTIQCILIDFLLILSNMNFLSSFWFWIVLHSDKIRSRVSVEIIMKFSFKDILLCFCWNHRSINSWKCSWYFVALFLHDCSNIMNSFWIEILTNCANFFDDFDVFDLSSLSWIIEIWNNWRLSLKMSTRSNAENCLLFALDFSLHRDNLLLKHCFEINFK